MLPTEDFGVKKTIAFAGCGFGACLPSDLCVLVSESDMLRRPGIVKGIEVKGRIKSIVGRLGVAGLRRRKWSGCGHDEVVRKGVVDDVEDVWSSLRSMWQYYSQSTDPQTITLVSHVPINGSNFRTEKLIGRSLAFERVLQLPCYPPSMTSVRGLIVSHPQYILSSATPTLHSPRPFR